MSVTVELKNGRRKQASYRDAKILTKLGKGRIVSDEPDSTENPSPTKGEKKQTAKKTRTYKRKDMTPENDNTESVGDAGSSVGVPAEEHTERASKVEQG